MYAPISISSENAPIHLQFLKISWVSSVTISIVIKQKICSEKTVSENGIHIVSYGIQYNNQKLINKLIKIITLISTMKERS